MDQQEQSRWQAIIRRTPAYVWIGGGFVLALVLILVGYHYKITLWDWAELLFVPAVLALGGYLFTRSENYRTQKLADQRAEEDQNLANDRRQDEALEAYLDQISQLLTDRGLRSKTHWLDEARVTARARSLAVLRRLDGERKKSVLQFLYEAQLINRSENGPLIGLSGADLTSTDLRYITLRNAALNGAHLENADLSEAKLNGADLGGADLSGADMSNAKLKGANLANADLQRKEERTLNGANLSGADLSGAIVRLTILFLGAMTVMLVVAGGVAFALVDCDQDHYCKCHVGVLCEGTHDTRPGYYDSITGTNSGDKIFAYEGDDEIWGYGSGDYIDAGPNDDTIIGDSAAYTDGNDTLIGGDGDDYITGGEGNDQCYGGPGDDTNGGSCEK